MASQADDSLAESSHLVKKAALAVGLTKAAGGFRKLPAVTIKPQQTPSACDAVAFSASTFVGYVEGLCCAG